jgi:hypothetical protein
MIQPQLLQFWKIWTSEELFQFLKIILDKRFQIFILTKSFFKWTLLNRLMGIDGRKHILQIMCKAFPQTDRDEIIIILITQCEKHSHRQTDRDIIILTLITQCDGLNIDKKMWKAFSQTDRDVMILILRTQCEKRSHRQKRNCVYMDKNMWKAFPQTDRDVMILILTTQCEKRSYRHIWSEWCLYRQENVKSVPTDRQIWNITMWK